MKTSKLIGPALDWAVAKCEGVPALRIVKKPEKTCVYGEVMGIDFPYQPSTDWPQGGPIIEREEIRIAKAHPTTSVWGALYSWGNDGQREYFGPTPLAAAMRCYVASKLGDEIEIPEELI